MDDELSADGDEDGTGEEDPFHETDGEPVLGDASAFEVGLYAHHCWVLGLDPDATAALLQESA